MKVEVIDDLCISCGACQSICPEVFDIDDKSYVKVDTVPDKYKEAVTDAIESCPTGAIQEVEKK